MEIRVLSLPNIQMQQVYYHWDIIKNDPDDNKFVDAAIASNAEYIVSEDKHFKALNRQDVVFITLVNADSFLEIVKGLNKR